MAAKDIRTTITLDTPTFEHLCQVSDNYGLTTRAGGPNISGAIRKLSELARQARVLVDPGVPYGGEGTA